VVAEQNNIMMRAMIVLSVLASSMASPLPQSEVVVPWTGPVAATIPAGLPGAGPNVADTAEVEAATNAFNAAFRAQLSAVLPVHATPVFVPAPAPAPIVKWWGPVAATIPAGLPGAGTNVAETAEVAAANAAFAQAYSAALAATTGQRV